MNNIVHNIDNMEFMKTVPDKYFELAIVDPPYGIGECGKKNHSRGGKKYKGISSKLYDVKDWDFKKPDKKYFNELFRISKNQIICGGNYFIEYLKNTSCLIIWDKENGKTDFADGEILWTSFKTAVRIFRYNYNGCWENNTFRTYERIHPTQKPVAMYKWLLTNYAKPNDKIFDSHIGSGSIRIACHELGFDLTGCELDKDYWEAQELRYKEWLKKFNNEFYIGDNDNNLFSGV